MKYILTFLVFIILSCTNAMSQPMVSTLPGAEQYSELSNYEQLNLSFQKTVYKEMSGNKSGYCYFGGGLCSFNGRNSNGSR